MTATLMAPDDYSDALAVDGPSSQDHLRACEYGREWKPLEEEFEKDSPLDAGRSRNRRVVGRAHV